LNHDAPAVTHHEEVDRTMFNRAFPGDPTAGELFAAVRAGSVVQVEAVLVKAEAQGRGRAEMLALRQAGNRQTALIVAASTRTIPASVVQKLLDEGADVKAYGGSCIETAALHYTAGAGDAHKTRCCSRRAPTRISCSTTMPVGAWTRLNWRAAARCCPWTPMA
jgi:hypothetical protein